MSLGLARSAGRRVWLLAALVLLAAAAALFFSPAAGAQAKDWQISNIDANLDVQKNGDVIVDEKVTFAFQGNYHFVTRAIPTGNMDGMTDLQVMDANGQPLPKGTGPGTWSTSTSGNERLITVNFDLTDTSGTWTFHYVAKSVVMFFEYCAVRAVCPVCAVTGGGHGSCLLRPGAGVVGQFVAGCQRHAVIL